MPAPTHDSLRARMERLSSPGFSFCLRCGRPWSRVKGHTTWYSSNEAGGGKGCFPLCESCWELLGCPEARIEYYKMLIDQWESELEVPEDDKRSIQRSVANGG